MQNVTTNFSYAEDKRIGIISISGMIDLSNVGDFSQFLDKVLQVTCKILVFDLNNLTYMNSTGFGALTSRAMNEPKFKIIFCNLENNISEVFSMFGLDNICDILPDLDSALEVAQSLVDDLGSVEGSKEKQDSKENKSTENSVEEKKEETFPVIKRCVSCEKKINFRSSGHYKCPRCQQILFINNEGVLTLIENPLTPSLPAVPETKDAPDEIVVTLPSDTNYLKKIREFIMSFTEDIFDEQETDKIAMAVDEACANAIEHAHHFDRTKKIFISLLINKIVFSVTVTDHGENTFIEQLDFSEEHIKKSGRGRGLMIMRKVMDDVQIAKTNSNGTSITLIKNLEHSE